MSSPTMKPFAQWEWNQHWDRPIAEALEELEREARMRLRCYDRWIADGRAARVESHNRMEALLSAIRFLREHEAMLSAREAAGLVVLPDPSGEVNNNAMPTETGVAEHLEQMRKAAG